MMKNWFVCVLTMLFALSAANSFASAPTTQVDALIEKLIDKGILTKDDAENLKGQIAYDAKQISDADIKKGVPDWVQNLKVGGDMRVRLQTERRESGAGAAQGERVRARMRARLNFEAKVSDQAKVVIGIASDGGTSSSPNNPRSNNYTFSTNNSGTPFSKQFVVLNKAYGQYMVNDQLTLTGGKMDNPVWEPMEFLWDSDITPEGVSAKYDYKIDDVFKLSSTGSFFSLGEFNPSTSDPFMYVMQSVLTAKPCDKLDGKLSIMYTGYGNAKSGFSGGNANNTLNAANGANGLKYNYNSVTGAADLGVNDPFGEMLPSFINIPRVGIFGEYNNNLGAPDKNVAWMAGAYLGNSKVSVPKAWKITGAYKVLPRDSWLDILPDSDFYGGATGAQGLEAVFEYGLAKNLSFSIDYYHARRIGSTVAKAPEHVIQYDILWKF